VAHQFGLGITPWSPLASGVLTGKYTRENATPDGSKRHSYAAPHLTEATFTLLDALSRIADELDTTIAATSLAWLLAQPAVTPLIGPRTMAQLDDNVASLHVHLTEAHLAQIGALSKPRLNYPADVITHIGTAFQQGGTTINGLASQRFARR
jgi:aryl-alcohol dehydrogenase-like predicted oxidoreductase